MNESGAKQTSNSRAGSGKMLPAFREMAVALAIILLANCATYSYVFAPTDPPRFIGTFDKWLFIGPSQFFFDSCIHSGEFPLWNPLILCGTPFAADPQMQVFYPLNLARSLLTFRPTPLRTHIGLEILTAIHILVAGLGAYCLTRYHGLSKSAGFIAAFVFVLNARIVQAVVFNPIYFAALAWMPWLFLAAFGAIDACTTRQFARRSILTGALLVLTILAGHPQFVIGIVVAFLVATFVYAYSSSGHCRENQQLSLSGRNMRLVLFGLIVAGVSAPGSLMLVLPASEFVQLSTRAKDSGFTAELRDYLDWPGAQSTLEMLILPQIGVGIGASLLMLLAVLVRPTRVVLVYAAVFYVFFDVAMGPPFPLSAAIAAVTPAESGAYFLSLILLPFPIALLSAKGADSLQTPIQGRIRRVVFGFLLIVFAVHLHVVRMAPSFTWLVSTSQQIEPNFETIITSCAFSCILVFAVFRKGRWVWPLAVTLLFIELLTLNWRDIPNAFQYFPNPYPLRELAESSRIGHANARVTASESTEYHCNQPMYKLNHSIGGYNGLMVASAYRTISSVETENAYRRAVGTDSALSNRRWGLFLKRRAWLTSTYVAGSLPAKSDLYPPTTTVFLHSAKPDRVREVYRDAVSSSAVSSNVIKVPIYANTRVGSAALTPERQDNSLRQHFVARDFEIPSLHAALRIQYRADCTAELKVTVKNTSTGAECDLVTSKLLPTDLSGMWLELPLPDYQRFDISLYVQKNDTAGSIDLLNMDAVVDRSDEGGNLQIVESSANAVTIELRGLEADRLLVFTQTIYPGWQAWLDGARTGILRADDCFMAVEVPPGDHVVRFVFRPWKVYVGVTISLVTILACIVGIAVPPTTYLQKLRRACQPKSNPVSTSDYSTTA